LSKEKSARHREHHLTGVFLINSNSSGTKSVTELIKRGPRAAIGVSKKRKCELELQAWGESHRKKKYLNDQPLHKCNSRKGAAISERGRKRGREKGGYN